MACSNIEITEVNRDIVAQMDEIYLGFNKLSLIEDNAVLNQRHRVLCEQLDELCNKYTAICSDYFLGIFIKVDKNSYFTNAILRCFGNMIAHGKNLNYACYMIGYLMMVGYLPYRVVLSPTGMNEYKMGTFFSEGLKAGDFRCEKYLKVYNIISMSNRYLNRDLQYEQFNKLYDLCYELEQGELFFEMFKAYRRFLILDSKQLRYPLGVKSQAFNERQFKKASLAIQYEGYFLENDVYSWLDEWPNVYMTKQFRKIVDYYKNNFETKRKEYYNRNLRSVIVDAIIDILLKIGCPVVLIIQLLMYLGGIGNHATFLILLLSICGTLLGYLYPSRITEAIRIVHQCGNNIDKKKAFERLLFYPDIFIPGFENIDYTDMERDDVRKLC